MKRLLFTIPDNVANQLQALVPAGNRSQFVAQYIEIPLRELGKKKKAKKQLDPKKIYKAKFLRDIARAEKEIKEGKVYSHEEVMKEFGLL